MNNALIVSSILVVLFASLWFRELYLRKSQGKFRGRELQLEEVQKAIEVRMQKIKEADDNELSPDERAGRWNK